MSFDTLQRNLKIATGFLRLWEDGAKRRWPRRCLLFQYGWFRVSFCFSNFLRRFRDMLRKVFLWRSISPSQPGVLVQFFRRPRSKRKTKILTKIFGRHGFFAETFWNVGILNFEALFWLRFGPMDLQHNQVVGQGRSWTCQNIANFVTSSEFFFKCLDLRAYGVYWYSCFVDLCSKKGWIFCPRAFRKTFDQHGFFSQNFLKICKLTQIFGAFGLSCSSARPWKAWFTQQERWWTQTVSFLTFCFCRTVFR